MSNNTELVQDLEKLKVRLQNLENDLKQRIQVLEDKEAILDVLARYGFTYDLMRLDEWCDLFTEDGVFNIDAHGKIDIVQGRDKLKALFKEMPYLAAQHLQLGVIIKVNGDNAKAIGFQVLTINKGDSETKPFIDNTFVRTWTLQRVKGKWLIKEAVSRVLKNLENCRAIVPADW
jgi:hypothetical protein